MKVTLRWEGTVLIARLWELDLPDAQALVEIFQIIEETEPQQVVLDCSELGHIASNGIASLIKLIQHVRRHGGAACLAAIPPRVERMLELVNLRGWVPFSPTVEKAIAAAG